MKNQLNIVIKEACERGLISGVYSGVSAAVSVVKKKVRYRGCFSGGMTRYDLAGVPVEAGTLFDLASLTKPLCTTLCTLHLVYSGRVHWNDTCHTLLDKHSPEKKRITIENILHHASGLPAYKPYYLKFLPKSSQETAIQIICNIKNESLEYLTGTTCVYSDLGFILLGSFLEKVEKLSLDQLFKNQITEPLGLAEKIHFMPLEGSLQKEKSTIAATEDCPWRKKIMQGEVHDEHSWLMGGVAGHAGLFGTAEGVLCLCECLLDCWQDRDSHPAFSNDLIRHALNWKDSRQSWRLGFDSPTPGLSSSGSFFTPQSVGHLGFTGTSFWIDPEQNIIVVLLTNRVHPSRENIKIRKFRPFFHDFIMKRIRA